MIRNVQITNAKRSIAISCKRNQAIEPNMTSGIGFVSGRDLSKETATEFAPAMGVNLGVAMVARELARGLAKLIPAAGLAITSAVAVTTTWALGQAAILYFLDGASEEQARWRCNLRSAQ